MQHRAFLMGAAGLLVGLVIGYWQPQGEKLALQEQVDTLKLQRIADCRGKPSDSLRSLFRAEPGDLGKATPPPGAPPDAPPPGDAPSADAPPPGAPPDGGAPGDKPRSAAEFQAEMNTALSARRAQALAALEEQADLSDAQVAQVNALMDDMNQKLKGRLDAFVADASEAGAVDRRDMMVFASDALDIVIEADSQLQGLIPADIYDDIDPQATDPLSYLTGPALSGLTQLEGLDMPFGRD